MKPWQFNTKPEEGKFSLKFAAQIGLATPQTFVFVQIFVFSSANGPPNFVLKKKIFVFVQISPDKEYTAYMQLEIKNTAATNMR